jgi:hypothetical protein
MAEWTEISWDGGKAKITRKLREAGTKPEFFVSYSHVSDSHGRIPLTANWTGQLNLATFRSSVPMGLYARLRELTTHPRCDEFFASDVVDRLRAEEGAFSEAPSSEAPEPRDTRSEVRLPADSSLSNPFKLGVKQPMRIPAEAVVFWYYNVGAMQYLAYLTKNMLVVDGPTGTKTTQLRIDEKTGHALRLDVTDLPDLPEYTLAALAQVNPSARHVALTPELFKRFYGGSYVQRETFEAVFGTSPPFPMHEEHPRITPMEDDIRSESPMMEAAKIVLDAHAQAAAMLAIERIERYVYTMLKERVGKRFPQVLLLPEGADRVLLTLIPWGVLYACIVAPEKVPQHEYVKTCAEYAIRGNAVKNVQYGGDVMTFAIAEVYGLLSEFADVGSKLQSGDMAGLATIADRMDEQQRVGSGLRAAEKVA